VPLVKKIISKIIDAFLAANKGVLFLDGHRFDFKEVRLMSELHNHCIDSTDPSVIPKTDTMTKLT